MTKQAADNDVSFIPNGNMPVKGLSNEDIRTMRDLMSDLKNVDTLDKFKMRKPL